MDIKGQGFEASIIAAKQSDEWLIEAADEIREAAKARGLELPAFVGSLAVDSATDTPEVLTPETADLFNTLTPEQQ
ncbi:hypothetical protein DYH10_04290, partial [Candidatus Saccharibacteria bacterium CPR2]|nr:hypothetical protein [Candidatus Saccharibacteria bacterium CPR2]